LYNSRWGIYCPENYPVKHAYATCIEIYGGNTLDITVKDRMDYAVYSDAKKFINEHIEFVNKPSGYRGEELRDLSLRMIKQRGINGFVTDPWNSLIPSKTKYGNEDKELEQELSAEQRFAINTNTNRIILAHPNTPLRDKDKVYPAPSPFEIKGGGIWFAKAYEILCSHLQSIGDNQYLTEIHVQKVKFQKETGLRTERNEPVLLKFERRSNRYIQQDGYNPFTSNETVEQVAELDLCF
jgi:predicted HAD superfamily phosphohydrolase YqeG